MKLKFLFLGILVILPACKSMYYYRSRAVQLAREYALEKLRKLPETKRDYIRYAAPTLMSSRLFDMEGEKVRSKRDIMQTWVVWKVPGLDESIVVVGVSDRQLRDWYPVRVIKKKFEVVEKNLVAAVAKARNYVMQKMLYLSTAERNRVRFTPPEILTTDFELKTTGRKWLKKIKNPTQTSFVWAADKSGERIVVSGIGEPDLSKWKPIIGQPRTMESMNP